MRGDGTGPYGTFRDCVAPDGSVRPRMRYLDPSLRPGLGLRFGRGFRGGRRRGRGRW